MGCGRSQIVEIYSRDQRNHERAIEAFKKQPKISVRIGNHIDVKHKPLTVFIFGGPGSKKGCVVDNLVKSFGMKHISIENIIQVELVNIFSKITNMDTSEALREAIENDNSCLTFDWVLNVIKKKIECSNESSFLIDIIPNQKHILKKLFLNADIAMLLEKFEDQFPVSFALNLALPSDKIISKQISSNHLGTEGKSDEADMIKLQKRATLYNQSVCSLINFFITTGRLVTVDVKCGLSHAIWRKVQDILLSLNIYPNRTVNTILLFTFKALEYDHAAYHNEIKSINLLELIEYNQKLPIDEILTKLVLYINKLKESFNFIVIECQDTFLSRIETHMVITEKKLIFNGYDAKDLTSLVSHIFKDFAFKAIASLENEICVFPLELNDSICTSIALHLSNIRTS